MRHGKAESFATEDHLRRLTERGVREVRAAGHWLAERSLVPTHAFVSSAVRTQETWAHLVAETGTDIEPLVSDALYTGGPESVLDILRGTPQDAEVVLYVGHNPTAASLAHLLDDGDPEPEAFRGMSSGLPTSAMAVLDVHLAWPELDAASARLVEFYPGSDDVDLSTPSGGRSMTAPRAVVLVEGHSDRVALQTLATRRGRDLAAEGVEVVAMGGITNTRAFASRYGPRGLGVLLAGLYDADEEIKLRQGLAGAGLDAALEPDGPSELGFYRCSADLEDELIRALGIEAVEAVIKAAGETRSLDLLAGMPAQRDWTREALLRRFLAVRSGRKARYAELLVHALDRDRVPEPLEAVLARV